MDVLSPVAESASKSQCGWRETESNQRFAVLFLTNENSIRAILSAYMNHQKPSLISITMVNGVYLKSH